jgi:hypothetical protein
MSGPLLFTDIDGLAWAAKLRARRRLYDGGFGLMAQRVIEDCTHALIVDDRRLALATYVREASDQACGWWKQPGLDRCRRLSVVFRDRTTNDILGQDREISLALARAFFGELTDRPWCETPPAERCKPLGYWHFRLFCDARGRSVPPRDVAFTRENAGVELPFMARTMANIAGEIAERHGVTLADLKGPGRYRAIAWPRHEVMWTLYQERNADGDRRWSLARIARFLGGRDHSTILHGVRAHEARLARAIAAGETL